MNSELQKIVNNEDPNAEQIRERVRERAKTFKTSWVDLGQGLYAAWNDKLYHKWGYEKFEHYVVQELGINKATAMRLLKTYYFVEEQEPVMLKPNYAAEKETAEVPNMDALNVLRLAKNKKEITRDDYSKLRNAVFVDGKDAGAIRKDLVSIMKERVQLDPEEERQQRNEASLRKALNILRTFKKDMESLKLVPAEVIEETNELIQLIESQID